MISLLHHDENNGVKLKPPSGREDVQRGITHFSTASLPSLVLTLVCRFSLEGSAWSAPGSLIFYTSPHQKYPTQENTDCQWPPLEGSLTHRPPSAAQTTPPPLLQKPCGSFLFFVSPWPPLSIPLKIKRERESESWEGWQAERGAEGRRARRGECALSVIQPGRGPPTLGCGNSIAAS